MENKILPNLKPSQMSDNMEIYGRIYEYNRRSGNKNFVVHNLADVN